ncbi:NAD-dependent epimerase/dehydratase family protein [Cytobacillus firmus]|uniref:NAD-dependent epimerase/dehydratase family protein n=1 Tax=Cytobacillus firmus TaxID=1399 RepID=UPI0021629838|nr:NAD-dependent epimerase/dehydratase family protein [Cytobacillus firmus]MCS0674067.1 NAD-dependent epimerase/dehydratase family protein [Cytobacillus firmus]
MKVLVTGGAGFIGSHIVDLLIEYGYKTVIVDNLSTGNKNFINPKAEFYKLDLTSPDLKKIFEKEKPHLVIHHAAQVIVTKSINSPLLDAQINILGTINLLQCCLEFNIKKIVYSSSSAVYGKTEDCSIEEGFPIQPISFYGISKYTPEQYISIFNQLYGLPFTILRYANVYGPRQTSNGEGGVVAIFIQNFLKEKPIIIYGDGTQTRDFIYVKDVAQANLLALKKGENEVINIGRNDKISINDLFYNISSKFSKPVPVEYAAIRKGDIQFSRLNNTKAMKILNWQPLYNVNNGLDETIEYYRKTL